MASLTTSLALLKPSTPADDGLWGPMVNSNFDAIDAALAAEKAARIAADAANVPTGLPAGMMLTRITNTEVRLSLTGSDGVVRVVSLTLAAPSDAYVEEGYVVPGYVT